MKLFQWMKTLSTLLREHMKYIVSLYKTIKYVRYLSMADKLKVILVI